MTRLSVCCFVCGRGMPVKSMVSGKISYAQRVVREGDYVRHQECSSRPDYESRRKAVFGVARAAYLDQAAMRRKRWVKA